MTSSHAQSVILRGLYLCRAQDSHISTPVMQVEATLEGLVGEKHSGFTRPADSRTPWYTRGTPIRNDRQVSIVSAEELALVAERIGVPGIQAEWLGANLLLEGCPDLTALPPNTRLFFESGAVLIITAENHPCSGPAKVIAAQTGVAEAAKLFPKLGMHKRGLVACVDHPGKICAGDVVSIKR